MNKFLLQGKRILITGGSGFIGSFLTEAFYKNNKVSLFDSGRRNSFQFLPQSIQNRISFTKGDIRDLETVKKIVRDQDIVIHLAAIAGASFYETDPLLVLEVNLFGTANLLQAVLQKEVEKIITFSTSEVYGSLASDVSEDDPTCIGPISEGRWSYAVSKVASDHLARAYFKKYALPINMIRPFNIYGPRQVGEGAIGNMLTSAIKKRKIYISGDGSQKRAWCFVSDMIQAVELVCTKNVYGECFNVGNPNAYVTILDLAKKIQSLVKGTEIVFTKAKEVEVLDRRPNVGKSNKLLGYSPIINLSEGLKITFDWWTKNISRF